MANKKLPPKTTVVPTPVEHSATYEEVQKIHPLYFNIVKRRYWWFAISLLLIIPGVFSLFTNGLNLGVDFKGGSMLDMKFNQAVHQSTITDTMKSVDLEGSVQLSNNDTSVLIRTTALEETKRNELLSALESKVGAFDKNSLKEDKVGPAIGKELSENAFKALVIASVLMLIYIGFRFQIAFAIAGILALLHDIVLVCGVFSLFQWQVDATFVAAILTIFGYSINDTVVIFDRIRENEIKMRRGDSYEDMVDKSIWQTMGRSIKTIATVVIALLSLYILGGESTRTFSFAMLIGVIAGAYSSIFNASQILVEIKNRMKSTRGGKAARA